MGIKVHTNISDEFDDIEVIINAPALTNEVQIITNNVTRMSSEINEIIGYKGNEIFLLPINEVFYIYSEEKNNFCKTDKGIFRIKQKLYELEEILPQNDFIRISNSKIVNLKYVECFDTSLIGSIIVKFKDGSYDYVSRRRVSQIMKFLKSRRR